ncbi:MAG TPA: protein kinase [Thermoanaerobaculia bacterium]|nr:protein kinase [Thermoanaerobaculia bacterium]
MKLSRFEVIRELGKGAMGVVYLARDPRIGRMVALKTIRQSSSPDDEVREFQQRFVREAQAAGILSHPAIVTVHDIGEDAESGVSFIAMEYVEGPNLKEMLNQGAALSFEQIAATIGQVAEALDFAHAKGIVHRDVKPANIIWCGESKVKITDFGIAKIATGANLTSTGQFLGTPNYMAPEQIRGASVDGRSDLFSLGIVLYELLTRKKPFGGDSLTTISYRIVHEPFPPLREVNPLIPEEFEDIVRRCLEKDPNARYQRGLEMARALENVVRSTRGIPAIPPMQPDATVVTRTDIDHEKIGTMELPYPEHEGMERAARRAGAIPKPAKAIGEDSVLRRPIPAAMFLGIALGLLAAVGVSAAVIWSNRVPTVQVDANLERQVAEQKRLRTEGNELKARGDVAGAREKYLELSRLAPNSPEVRSILTSLDSTLGNEQSERQKVAASLEKVDAGMALMVKKDYTGAAKQFQEALVLNPNSAQAGNLLEIAQLQQQKVEASKAARVVPLVLGNRKIGDAPRPDVTPLPGQTRPLAGATATIQVVFDSPVNNGYLAVKVDGKFLVHELLFEKTRNIFKGQVARKIRVAREVPAKSSELDVWVVVPNMNLDRKILRCVCSPGGSYTLTIRLDKNRRELTASIS